MAVDVGAAAGGFTQALLDAGVARVYAVDAGVGQLRGRFQADHRVIDPRRPNWAAWGRTWSQNRSTSWSWTCRTCLSPMPYPSSTS